MKQMTKRLVGLILLGTLASPLWANTEETRIFPSYTGLKAQASTEVVEMRNYPSQYSAQIETNTDENLYILGQNHNWYRVRIEGKEGWISKDALCISDDSIVPYSKVLGEEIVAYGKLFIGTPYVWGGNDLKNGVDCSGLTKKVFEGFDINISRLSYTQVNDGKEVSKSELRPGDLVFFDTSGKNNGHISHVGIYAGNNMFLHADCTRGVMISSLSNVYYERNYVTGSRILSNLS